MRPGRPDAPDIPPEPSPCQQPARWCSPAAGGQVCGLGVGGTAADALEVPGTGAKGTRSTVTGRRKPGMGFGFQGP